MTATVARLIAEALPSTPAQALAVATDWILAIVVIGLLTGRVLLQVAGRPRASRAARILDVATVPLVAGFALVVYTRLQEIMPLG